jgi:hypothetical protein
MKLSISDTQHKSHSAEQRSAIKLSIAFYIILLNVIMMIGVMLNVVMLSVMAP